MCSVITLFTPLTLKTEHLFNLKFAAKELQRNSKKCDKEEKAEKAKVKKVHKDRVFFTAFLKEVSF